MQDRRHNAKSLGAGDHALFKDVDTMQKDNKANEHNYDDSRKMSGGEDLDSSNQLLSHMIEGNRNSSISFIKTQRQALKLKKIKKDISEEENKGAAQDGVAAGASTKLSLNPRTKKYDAQAREAYQLQEKALTKEELEFNKESELFKQNIEQYELKGSQQQQDSSKLGDHSKILNDLDIDPGDLPANQSFLDNEDFL